MAVNAQHPGKIGGDLFFQLEQGVGDLVELGPAFRLEIRLAGIEEDLGLQDETVPDDTDVGAIAEDFTQLAEEIRAVALEFVDALGQCEVEPLAQFGDAALGILVLLFGASSVCSSAAN